MYIWKLFSKMILQKLIINNVYYINEFNAHYIEVTKCIYNGNVHKSNVKFMLNYMYTSRLE